MLRKVIEKIKDTLGGIADILDSLIWHPLICIIIMAFLLFLLYIFLF